MSDRVLVVDDEEASRTGLRSLLSTWGFQVEEAANGAQALEQALAFRPAVVIADLVMPGMDGLELLPGLATSAAASVILLTGNATVDTAVAAMKEGAYDYITKPIDVRRLRVVIDKAVERAGPSARWPLRGGSSRSEGPRAAARQESGHAGGVRADRAGRAHGRPRAHPGRERHGQGAGGARHSSAVAAAQRRLRRRELLRHPRGPARERALGHEKGAFTGAVERRAGYFELADGGTIFLDEIAEMAPAFQAKYLRVVQDNVVRGVGGKRRSSVDVRILSATNKDPSGPSGRARSGRISTIG